MPSYRIKLANGKSLVLRGDEPPTDQDIEQAATAAGVRSLLMSSDKGEAPATGLSGSNSTAPSLPTLASGAMTAGMAAAPAIVTGLNAAAGVAGKYAVPGLTAAYAAKHAYEGDPMRAAGDVALGSTAAATKKVADVVSKATASPSGQLGLFTRGGGIVARLATALRGASPYAAGLTAISALHDVNEQQRQRIMADPEVEETTKKAVELLLRQMAEREAR